MMRSELSFSSVGESAILVAFYRETSQNLATRNQLISIFTRQLLNVSPQWLLDVLPSFDTLLVNYNDAMIDRFGVISFLSALVTEEVVTNQKDFESKQHCIPVFFGRPTEDSPFDLDKILVQKNIDEEQFIRDYVDISYRIYAIGFLPNFAYCGEISEHLSMPRLPSPRSFVPKGAVAIADRQTAIYPQNSAGGWNILGYTPVTHEFGGQIQFDVGDELVFEPISHQRFMAMNE